MEGEVQEECYDGQKEEEEEGRQGEEKEEKGEAKEEKSQVEVEEYYNNNYYYSYLPILSFESPPMRLYHLHHLFNQPPTSNNFLKAVKWSPDGSCFLTSTDSNHLQIFDLPMDAMDDSTIGVSCLNTDSFTTAVHICEGECVYDFCWYPLMMATDPTSCVFVTTVRDHPIHLWDAISGQLRCSYRAYDAMDEITTAFSVGFNPSGTKLFCGYNKTLRIFDISRPGREYKEYSTLTRTKEGQTGIISCIAFNPCDTKTFAAGSYDRTVALYSEDTAELLYVLHGHEGGVTQVQFSKDGNYLYTGGRKDPFILCWDIRNTSGIMYKLQRRAKDTNQRIAFDIEPYGRHLASGGQDGQVCVFDLQTGEGIMSFEAAEDTVNGFSFHPSLPLAVSSSGHRRFHFPDDEFQEKHISPLENCASVWKFACSWYGGSSDISKTTEKDANREGILISAKSDSILDGPMNDV